MAVSCSLFLRLSSRRVSVSIRLRRSSSTRSCSSAILLRASSVGSDDLIDGVRPDIMDGVRSEACESWLRASSTPLGAMEGGAAGALSAAAGATLLLALALAMLLALAVLGGGSDCESSVLNEWAKGSDCGGGRPATARSFATRCLQPTSACTLTVVMRFAIDVQLPALLKKFKSSKSNNSTNYISSVSWRVRKAERQSALAPLHVQYVFNVFGGRPKYTVYLVYLVQIH